MSNIQNIYNLILEMDKLKVVLRNTLSTPDRKESTAEHSWSASMIVIILMDELKKEFPEIDELKTLKLIMIHDTVEVYAGDVLAFDKEARKNKEKVEADALKQLVAVNPAFGYQLHELWNEFEAKLTIEAKVAKAADAICPMFQRLLVKQSYLPYDITVANLDETKYNLFKFSQTFSELYQKLKIDLLANGMIVEK